MASTQAKASRMATAVAELRRTSTALCSALGLELEPPVMTRDEEINRIALLEYAGQVFGAALQALPATQKKAKSL